jgi:rhodanese-related sulfurtransferase
VDGWARARRPPHCDASSGGARLGEISRDRRVALTCAGGTRSSLVGSMLLGRGYTHLLNVWGGTAGWAEAWLPTIRTETRAPEPASRPIA